MIYEIFSPQKIGGKIGNFDSEYCYCMSEGIITLNWEKIAFFSPKMGKKSLKIVIMTMTHRNKSTRIHTYIGMKEQRDLLLFSFISQHSTLSATTAFQIVVSLSLLGFGELTQDLSVLR
jgi:hypothetical protein